MERTDWRRIVSLYDELLRLTRSPVVALNRAVALAEVQGAEIALEAIDGLDLGRYYLVHATRAELLVRLSRFGEARDALARAVSLAPSEGERRLLRERLEALSAC